MPWREGERRFNRCPFKEVRFVDFVYTSEAEADRNGNRVQSTEPMYDRRPYAGSGAYLVCPVTQFTGQKIESQFSNHRGRLEATNSVMQLAGRLLCGNCRYGDMTQAEFAYDQADYLSAQAERNDAQADLIESQQRLRALTGEQQPPYLLPHERQPD